MMFKNKKSVDSVSKIGNCNLTCKDWENYLFVMEAPGIASTLYFHIDSFVVALDLFEISIDYVGFKYDPVYGLFGFAF